jgi:hypothetical protein
VVGLDQVAATENEHEVVAADGWADRGAVDLDLCATGLLDERLPVVGPDTNHRAGEPIGGRRRARRARCVRRTRYRSPTDQRNREGTCRADSAEPSHANQTRDEVPPFLRRHCRKSGDGSFGVYWLGKNPITVWSS